MPTRRYVFFGGCIDAKAVDIHKQKDLRFFFGGADASMRRAVDIHKQKDLIYFFFGGCIDAKAVLIFINKRTTEIKKNNWRMHRCEGY